jgi:small subunit ribosomal protein S18
MPRQTSRKDSRGGRAGGDRDRRDNNMDFGAGFRRGKVAEGIRSFDYKDSELLRKFLTERGKLMPRRLVGTTAKQQRQVKKAIRRARSVGLVP